MPTTFEHANFCLPLLTKTLYFKPRGQLIKNLEPQTLTIKASHSQVHSQTMHVPTLLSQLRSRLRSYGNRACLCRIISLQALAPSANARGRPRGRCVRRGFCPDRAVQPACLRYLFPHVCKFVWFCVFACALKSGMYVTCAPVPHDALSPPGPAPLWPTSRIRLVIASYS